MRDTKELLRETRDRVAPPADVLGSLERRRHHREQARRVSAAVVALVIALVGLAGWLAVERDTAVPAVDPSRSDLGIFADVRGWIVYSDFFKREQGIWAIDPANPDTEPVLLYPDGGLPIAWANDGSKLLISNDDPSIPGPRGLLVLDADGRITRVADPASGYRTGTFTPDGSHVIYVADSGIYSVASDGGSPSLLHSYGAGDGVYTVALSPDGSRLAWFEGHGDALNSLWEMNVDGTDRHQIIGEGEAGRTPWSLQWSPDGTQLAFKRGADRGFGVINADGTDLSFVRSFGTVDADGTDGTFIPAFIPDLGPWAGPYWSPDGTSLAFATGRARSPSLSISRPDGTELQVIGSGGPGPWNPLDPAPAPSSTQTDALGIFAPVAGQIVYGDGSEIWGVDPGKPLDLSTKVHLTSEEGDPLGWSSGGTRLLIMVDEGHGARLLVLHADGSETQVAEERPGIAGATISPDGSRVVFATHMALYNVDVAGGRPVLLVRGGGDSVYAPTFSPDGGKIAYVVGSGDHDFRIWMANADGSDAREIVRNETTLGPSHVYGLAWSPAGDRIAYANEGGTYTFAPDGSNFTQVSTIGMHPYWSPDGSQLAYSWGPWNPAQPGGA